MHTYFLAALALSAPAVAQIVTLTPETPGNPFQREVHAGPPATLGGFRKACAGHLTGHALPDVAILAETSVRLAPAPGLHDSVIGLGPLGVGNVLDIAVLSGGGNGALDRLVVLGDAGLVLWSFDPVGRLVSTEGLPLPVGCVAERIATHPSDTQTVFVVADGGCTIVTAPLPGGPSLQVVAALPSPARDVECIDWDGDGDAELAVVTDAALHIVGSGVSPESFTLGASDITDLCLVRNAGQEWLAWLRPGSFTDLELALRSLHGACQIPLDNHGYTRLAAGDWNGDQREELALSTAANDDLTVLFNVSVSAPHLFYCDGAVAARLEVIGDGIPRQSNACNAVFTDLDGDQDGDILVPVASGVSGEEPALAMLRPTIHMNASLIQIAAQSGSAVWSSASPEQFHIAFSCAPAPGVTHIEVLAWPSVGTDPAEGPEIQAAPTYRHLMPVSLVAPMSGVYVLDFADPALSDGPTSSHLGASGFYMVSFRPVVVGANQEIQAAGMPCLTAIYTKDDALYSLVPGGPWGGPGNGVRVGGIVRHRPLPPLPPQSGVPSSRRQN